MHKTIFDHLHAYDTSGLSDFRSRPQRIHFDTTNCTPEIPATSLTSLHITTKSFLEILPWEKNAVLVVCPERSYPYEVYTQDNRIVITEKPYKPKGTITLFAPSRLDFLNITLHDDAVCAADITGHLVSVTTTGTSHAHVMSEHLFAQSLDESEITATMIPRRANNSETRRPGRIVALYAGRSFEIRGVYESAVIAFTKAQTLLHPAYADKMTAYLLPTVRTDKTTGHGPILKLPYGSNLENHLQVQDLHVTRGVFRKTMGTYLADMMTNFGIRP